MKGNSPKGVGSGGEGYKPTGALGGASSKSSMVLAVQNLSKHYSPGQNVWSEVNFDLAGGEFLYILGGSGAGKSSLLRCLARSESPSSGQVVLPQFPEKEWNRKIAFIPQDLGLIPELTIRQHVEIVWHPLRLSDRTPQELWESYLNTLMLRPLLDKRVVTLSGGEKQRVAILRALSRKSEILIADEPTGAQDFEMTWKVMDLFMKQQAQGTAVLLATHDLEMVRRLRKRCAVLKEGQFKVEDRL